MNVNDLRAQRAGLVKDMTDLSKKASEEKRNLSPDEDLKWAKMDEDQTSLKKQIERAEKLAQLNTEFNDSEARKLEGAPKQSKKEIPYADALNAYLRKGNQGLSREERSSLEKRGTATQIVGTTTLGGHTVSQEWYNKILVDMAAWGGMIDNCTVLNTSGAGQLNFPNFDDTANVATLLTETTADTVKDLTFGTKQLDGYLYTSGIVKASVELIQDSAYDIESYLGQAMARRLGSGINGAFTVADGSSKPQGIVPAATDSGVTTASATTMTHAEIMDVVHAVDPAYRRSPSCKFSFNDNTLAMLRKIIDGQGRPLWSYDARANEPDKIAGFGYFINQDIVDQATTAKFMLFGDFSQYYIRVIGGIVISQSDEFYWSTRERGYVTYMRVDGDLIGDASAIVWADAT